MVKAIKKILLPFATCSQEGAVFNEEIEKASIFSLIELKREKGGGVFRKRDTEKIIFISKVYYPFWIVPVRDMTLLLDGLNIASFEISHSVLPDLQAFKDNLNKCSLTRQLYTDFIFNNQTFFESSSENQTIIEGLVNDAEFTKELLNCINEAIITKSPIVDSVLITPAQDKEEVTKMMQSVEKSRLKLEKELVNLNEIIKLLNLKTKKIQDSLSKEIKATETKFSKQIQKIKKALKKRVDNISKEYSKKVKKITKRFEKKIKNQHKAILKIKKMKERLESEIGRVELEIKNSAIRKDESTEKKWQDKRKQLRNEHRKSASKLKELETHLSEIEDNLKNELFLLKQDNEVKIKEASKDLVDIEAARDAEIKTCQDEAEKIEELTSNVIEKVDELAKNREAVLLEFDELGIKQLRTNISLIYLPFYLSCYQYKSNKRYAYLAPSSVSDYCLGLRIRTLGRKKINQFFQPRFNKIISIINSFIVMLDENIVFNREINEACLKANFLQMEKAQELVRNGLIKLREQGWLSESEFRSFDDSVSHFFR